MAYGFDEGKNKVTFADYFTYVIDSQAKFDDWVNGVSGNDYSYVAIIGGKGSGSGGAYVQTISNDLTDKTKGIQGFCGARIEADVSREPVQYGLRYAVTPSGTDYFIKDLTLDIINGYGFFNCTNLHNCTGISTSYVSGGSSPNGFFKCTNLHNCIGTALGQGSYLGTINGFSDCTNLHNCTGSGESINTSNVTYGFNFCKRLSFCTATGKTAKYVNCYVTSTANETYKIPVNGSDTPNGGFNV